MRICFAFIFFAKVAQCNLEKSWYRCVIREEIQLLFTFDKSSLKYGESEQSISPRTLTFVDAKSAIIAPNENPSIYFFFEFIVLYFFRKYSQFCEIVVWRQRIVTGTGRYPWLLRILAISLYALFVGRCLNPGIINMV